MFDFNDDEHNSKPTVYFMIKNIINDFTTADLAELNPTFHNITHENAYKQMLILQRRFRYEEFTKDQEFFYAIAMELIAPEFLSTGWEEVPKSFELYDRVYDWLHTRGYVVPDANKAIVFNDVGEEIREKLSGFFIDDGEAIAIKNVPVIYLIDVLYVSEGNPDNDFLSILNTSPVFDLLQI